MKVTAIIVNYYTSAILPPLLDNLFDDPLVVKAIVVDNSGEMNSDIVAGYPRAEVIQNPLNRGFGAAVNQAVAHSTGEWLLVMNPDVRLCNGCLTELVSAGEKYGCPLLGPRFYWDENFQFRLPPATGDCLWIDAANDAAEKFSLDGELFSFYWILRHQRFWEAKEAFFEPFLTGACMLLRSEWIESLDHKVFDERFFLYFEDTDLCARAIKNGIRPLCVPQAVAIHYWDQSPSPDNSKSSLMARAHEHFVNKYYGEIRFSHLKSIGCKSLVFDFGEAKRPPVFLSNTAVNDEPLYFELGVNPYFVPFAQTSLNTNHFEFPPEIWSKLGRGTYYGRIRGPVSGALGIWKWRK
jgi:GT2 family glycosyltransferase